MYVSLAVSHINAQLHKQDSVYVQSAVSVDDPDRPKQPDVPRVDVCILK